jgi:integrase
MPDLAETMKARARTGEDIIGDKKAKAAEEQAAETAATVGALIDVFLAEREEKTRKWAWLISTSAGSQSTAGGSKIIARSHVVDGIDDVAKTRGKVAADRCKTALSTFFVWCADHGFCDLNPTMHIKNRAGNGSRERVLSVQEHMEVWRACGSDDFGHIAKLLLLSGFRRQEIGDLSWTEVHLGERLIKLPGERVKNKRAHAIWLSDQSLAILTSIPASETRNLVFGRGADGYGGRQGST